MKYELSGELREAKQKREGKNENSEFLGESYNTINSNVQNNDINVEEKKIF